MTQAYKYSQRSFIDILLCSLTENNKERNIQERVSSSFQSRGVLMFESLLIITGTNAPTLRRPCSQTDPELLIFLPTVMTTETNGSEPQDLVLLLWTAERYASSFWLKSPSICQAQWPRPGVLLLMLSLSLQRELMLKGILAVPQSLS